MDRVTKAEALEQKRQRFVTKYETYFGTWPGAKDPEQADEWFRLIDNVPLDKLEAVFSVVLKEHGKRLGAPRCGLFWLAWKQIRPVRQRVDAPPQEYCGLCENTGRMWCVGSFVPDDHGGHFEPMRNREALGPVYRYVVHCVCNAGERYRHLSTEAQRAEVLAWRREILPSLVSQRMLSFEGTPELWTAADILKAVNRKTVQPKEESQPVEARSSESSRNAKQNGSENIYEPSNNNAVYESNSVDDWTKAVDAAEEAAFVKTPYRPRVASESNAIHESCPANETQQAQRMDSELTSMPEPHFGKVQHDEELPF